MSLHNQITPNEILFLKENTHLSPIEIGNILHRHPTTIRKIAHLHHIKLKKHYNEPTYVNPNFFKNPSKNMFYILGFLSADGCLMTTPRGGRIIELTINQKDQFLLNQIKQELNYTKPLKMIPKTNAIRLHISSITMFNDLLKYNLTPRKSLTLKFPLNIPDIYLSDYIRGYFDGDGSIRITSGYVNQNQLCFPHLEISFLGTFEYLSELKKLLNQKNILYGSILHQKQFNCYRLTFGGTDSSFNLGQFLYNDKSLFLERKYIVFKNYELVFKKQLTKNEMFTLIEANKQKSICQHLNSRQEKVELENQSFKLI